jgi:hypothetical protein
MSVYDARDASISMSNVSDSKRFEICGSANGTSEI